MIKFENSIDQKKTFNINVITFPMIFKLLIHHYKIPNLPLTDWKLLLQNFNCKSKIIKSYYNRKNNDQSTICGIYVNDYS